MKINEIEQINDQLYCIKEVNSTNMYLMIGSEKALLIDTGYGYSKVTDLIRQITDKELLVAVTHGDPDHALGSYQFPQVMIHPADLEDLNAYDCQKFKQASIDYRLSKIPDLGDYMDVHAYLHTSLKDTEFIMIREGSQIDLGDMCLEVIEIPGHSKGSVAFLERSLGWLFTGDTITKYNIWNNSQFMTHCDPLSVMMRSYDKILNRKDDIREIYPAHGEHPITIDIIDELKACIRDLLVHHTNDEHIQTFVGPAYRHVYKERVLLYTKEMLEEALQNGVEK